MNLAKWNNVFLADDDFEDREIFSEALKQVHPESKLTLLFNGKELMQLLHKPPVPLPDIIFLDLNMPVKSGYECLAEIRNTPGMENYKVVIFTTAGHTNDIDKLYDLGANLFITKPSSYTTLTTILENLFTGHYLEGVQQPSREEFAWHY